MIISLKGPYCEQIKKYVMLVDDIEERKFLATKLNFLEIVLEVKQSKSEHFIFLKNLKNIFLVL